MSDNATALRVGDRVATHEGEVGRITGKMEGYVWVSIPSLRKVVRLPPNRVRYEPTEEEIAQRAAAIRQGWVPILEVARTVQRVGELEPLEWHGVLVEDFGL